MCKRFLLVALVVDRQPGAGRAGFGLSCRLPSVRGILLRGLRSPQP